MSKTEHPQKPALPPHRRIEAELRILLRKENLKPHSPFLSEMELCERFKVNVATIRKSVRLLEAEGLIYKIHRKGTFVSPPSRNRLILFVTTELSFSTVGALTPIASKYPTFQWLEFPVEELRPIVGDVRHVFPRLKGVFFVRDLPKCIDVIRAVQTQGIPTFFYGSDAHTPFLERTNALLYREREMTYMALNHLKSTGCRKIGFLGTDDRLVFSTRHEYYLKWMGENGFKINQSNVISPPEGDLFDPLKSFARVREHLARKDCDADGFFCANEQCSATMIQAAVSLGISIPARLKTAGIEDDGVVTEKVHPQPTSVRIPFGDDVRESFKSLTEIIESDGGIVRKWSPHYLIRRQSS